MINYSFNLYQQIYKCFHYNLVNPFQSFVNKVLTTQLEFKFD